MRDELRGQRGSAAGLGLSAIALLLYLLLLIPLAQQAAGWYFLARTSEGSLLSAARYDKQNEIYPYLLGRLYLMNIENPAPEKAVAYYRRSISLNPLQAGAWTGLSRAYQMSGKVSDAEYALERAVMLSPHDAGLMWDAGTFWLMNNKIDRAFRAFRKYLLIEPGLQTMVYDLSWKVQPDNAYILDNLVPQAYEYQAAYLAYLISEKRADAAQEVWESLDQGSLQKKDFLSYVDFLIASGQYDRAEAVWKDITGKIEGMAKEDGSSLLWNYGFENEMLNGGFDWRIRETDGVKVFLDEAVHMTGRRSLGVLFDGSRNPDIAFATQVVRVSPGASYLLRGSIKTDALTTTNGIFLQVVGHNCGGLDKRSDEITGTTFWKEVTLEFEAPASCGAVIVMARRERSIKLDNKIEGTAWIDRMTLKQQAFTPTSSSKRH